MSLRVLAVSAPEFPFGRTRTMSLSSREPVSLYNACRYAAFLADNRLGLWGESNWAESRKERKKKVLLLNSLSEELPYLENMLAKERPNLLLIGAMTMCFPGAIECAKIAKQMYGEQIFVVLGGRHANETVYLDKETNEPTHHNGSPLKLVAEGKIDDVFDLIISGEGEMLIAKIGEVIADFSQRGRFSKGTKEIAGNILKSKLANVAGKWIVGYVDHGQIITKNSSGMAIDRDSLPSTAKMFGVSGSFDVFDGRLTGHAFSDMSSGCVYDCEFCSERSSVNGPLSQIETSASRLFKSIIDIHDVIREDSAASQASAFIEDSMILGGLTPQLDMFCKMLSDHPVDLLFGGQFTIDAAIRQKAIIEKLQARGLTYLFVGMETLDHEVASVMSKNIGTGSWTERAEKVIAEFAEIGIKVGFSVLFGLGESQKQRIAVIEQLLKWKQSYRNPVIASFNWAFQHPLKGNDNGAGYDYLDWGLNDPEYIDYFMNFGEASVKYPIPMAEKPTKAEMAELQQPVKELVTYLP